MFEEAIKYYEARDYASAEKILRKLLKEGSDDRIKLQQLLAKINYEMGAYGMAIQYIDDTLSIDPENFLLKDLRKRCETEYQTLQSGIDQITNGQHTTDEINALKANTQHLIDTQHYGAALEQLKILSVARKAKTTNILWIGKGWLWD